jgi:hypothetical protein
MAHTNRNFILAYILLVGLPLLGLVGALRSGRKLTAPVSVDGLWLLQADSAELTAFPCGKMLAENPDAALAISQSGRNFTLTLPSDLKSIGSGSLSGTALQASLAPSPAWSQESGCGSDKELSLMAAVDPKANPRSLVGRLSISNCASCGSVQFRAFRQTPKPQRELR